jgi:CDP-glucose 4,6-dehydratase
MALSGGGFWSGRRVLLTGHTGFKGAWCARWLWRLGAQVTGYGLEPQTIPSLFALLEPTMRIASRLGDLRDREALRAAVVACDPEIVIHMAAQALLPKSYEQPVETWSSNLLGTVELLEALRGRPALRAILVVTSDKVYADDGAPRRHVEADRLGGEDPYSASKAAVELAVASWRHSFAPDGPPIATARAGNVIGGGDWAADRLVPDLVRAVTSGRPLALRSPRSTRPWQHVLDPLAGYLLYAECLVSGAPLPPALNFGPAEAESAAVLALVERLYQAFGEPAQWHHAPRPDIPERHALALDAGLARETFGWRPRLGIEAAIDWTVDWYAAFRRGVEAAEISDQQIARYEALATERALS